MLSYNLAMFTVAIANHKGGVGKTATAQALGAALAEMGQRVLLVDLDPQASLTAACNAIDEAVEGNIAQVLGGTRPGRTPLQDILVQLEDGSYIAPANMDLANSQLGLTNRMGRENVVRKALASVAKGFDIAIIDTAPGLGLLTVAGLVASQAVLVPTQPHAADMRGLVLFMNTVTQVQEDLNPGLAVAGVLVTFFEARQKHHKEAVAVMDRNHVPLAPLTIGRSVRVAEAMGYGESIITYDPENPRANEYRQLAAYLLQWQNENLP